MALAEDQRRLGAELGSDSDEGEGVQYAEHLDSDGELPDVGGA